MNFLRNIFGPSQNEIWKQFSDQVGGKFIQVGFFQSKVEIPHKHWNITFDTYSVGGDSETIHFTILTVPYVNKDGFQFNIFRAGHLVDLFLHVRETENIDIGFDRLFTVRGNNVHQLHELFRSEKLRRCIAQQPKGFDMRVREFEAESLKIGVPGAVQLVSIQVPGVVKDIERLKILHDLMVELLNQLCHIGSASDHDPGITLP